MVDPSLETGDRQSLCDVCRGEDIFRCFLDHCDRSEVAEQAAWPDVSAEVFSLNTRESHPRARVKHRYSLPAVQLS